MDLFYLQIEATLAQHALDARVHDGELVVGRVRTPRLRLLHVFLTQVEVGTCATFEAQADDRVHLARVADDVVHFFGGHFLIFWFELDANKC